MIKFSELENSILSYWKEHKIFAKTLAKPAPQGKFVFFEGPPTANGKPGLHHVLARAFKDLIPRYKTMQGFKVDRKAGWDTQGLPVELQVEKELKFKGKSDIEQYGVEEFNSKCKAAVWKYQNEWEKLTERIGYWLDLEKPYITYQPYYIESLWWIFKQIWRTWVSQSDSQPVMESENEFRVSDECPGEGWQRMLYQDYKVVPHCPRCGTALSSHEVAQGYKEITEPSVYIKFKVKSQKSPPKADPPPSARHLAEPRLWRGVLAEKVKIENNTYILSWTTTPWTLPGNVALAIGADIDYLMLEVETSDVSDIQKGEVFILARSAFTNVFESTLGYSPHPHEDDLTWGSTNFKGKGNVLFKNIRLLRGSELVGLEYEPLFDIKPLQNEKSHRVYAADFVNTTDGTGVVHTAVMYGEDDFNLGGQVGLPKFHTVDENGCFTKDVDKWAGKFVKDKEVEQGIVEDLKERGLLFKQEMYTHDYPYCWRCDTPLLYYAKPSWFIKMSALREDLKAANEIINWYPEHIKQGRFGEWLDGVKDWAISRERYWGTPLPIWMCGDCSNQICVGSFQELSDLANESQKSKIKSQNFDPHRPYVDDIGWFCKCGGKMRRVPEVADCWFDSGSMPFAQWGYPATRGSAQQLPDHYPAEFIAEAIDQTRGWFYTLLAVATLLKKAGAISEIPPYRNVICLGHINDKYGQKMSKSKGNIIDPWEIINQYGADALRFYFYTASQPGEPKNFDPKDVEAVVKKTFLILMNVVMFYELYRVPVARPKASDGTRQVPQVTHVLDRWILAMWYKLLDEVTEYLENYKVTEAGRKIEEFITDLSVWYVRRSRDRFKQENRKMEALNTLRHVLLNLSKIMSPFVPFLSEHIYRRVGGELESVHLAEWPSLYADNDDPELLIKMSKLRQVVETVLAQRAAAKIKVRQALRVVTVKGLILADEMKAILADEINVLEVVCEEAGELSVVLNTEIDDELKALGLIREFSRQVNALRKQRGLTINDRIMLKVGATEKIAVILSNHRDNLLKSTLSKEINISQEEYDNKLEIEGEAVTVEIS